MKHELCVQAPLVEHAIDELPEAPAVVPGRPEPNCGRRDPVQNSMCETTYASKRLGQAVDHAYGAIRQAGTERSDRDWHLQQVRRPWPRDVVKVDPIRLVREVGVIAATSPGWVSQRRLPTDERRHRTIDLVALVEQDLRIA